MRYEPYNSSLLDNVQKWLEPLNEHYRADSKAEAESALQDSLKIVGFGAPFDREQRHLNNLLVFNGANKLACLTVWAYYYDYKIATAKPHFDVQNSLLYQDAIKK